MLLWFWLAGSKFQLFVQLSSDWGLAHNPGPVVTSILTIWYKSHLAQGGAPDALMEELKTQGQRTN